MDNDIIDLLDSDEDIFLTPEDPDKLIELTGTLTDKIESCSLSKTVKLEAISHELAQTEEPYIECSDNEDYDDSFETNDLIEYENVNEAQSDSAQPNDDDDDSDIVFIEDISQKTSQFIIPIEQIKTENIESLAPNTETMCPSKSPVNEASVSLPESKEIDDSAICIISSVYTEPDDYLDSHSKSPSLSSTHVEEISDSDICLISSAYSDQYLNSLPTTEESISVSQKTENDNDKISNNDFCTSPVENMESPSKLPIIEESPFSAQQHEIDRAESLNHARVIEESYFSPKLDKNIEAESAIDKVFRKSSVNIVEHLIFSPKSLTIEEIPIHKDDNAESSYDDIRLISSADIEKEVENLEFPLNSPVNEDCYFSSQENEIDDSSNNDIRLISSVDIEKEVENLDFPLKSPVFGSSQDQRIDDAENSNVETCPIRSAEEVQNSKSEDIEPHAANSLSTVTPPLKSPVNEASLSLPDHEESDDNICNKSTEYTEPDAYLDSPSKSPSTSSAQHIEECSNSDICLISSACLDSSSEGISSPQQTENKKAKIQNEVKNLESPSMSLIIDSNPSSPQDSKIHEHESLNNKTCFISSVDIEKEVESSESPIIEKRPTSPQDHVNDDACSSNNTEKPEKKLDPSLISPTNGKAPLHTENGNYESSNNGASLADLEKLPSPTENYNDLTLHITISIVEPDSLGLEHNEENVNAKSAEIATSFVEEGSLPLNSSKESIELAISLEEEDLLLWESPNEIDEDQSCKNLTSIVDEDALLLQSPIHESPINAVIFKEDSLLLQSTKEFSEVTSPKSVQAFVDENEVLSESSKDESQINAVSLEEEHLSVLEFKDDRPMFVGELLQPLNTEDENHKNQTSIVEKNSDSLKNATSFDEEDSSPGKTSKDKDGNALLLESTKENAKNESIENAASFTEKNSLLLKCPKEKSEEETPQSTASSIFEKALLLELVKENDRDESPKNATNFAKVLLPKQNGEYEIPDHAVSLVDPEGKSETKTTVVKEDVLPLDAPSGGNESSNDATSLVEQDSSISESPKEKSEACPPKTATIWVKADSLLLDSRRAGDGSSKDAASLIEEDSSQVEPPREKSEACTQKSNTIWVKKDLLLLDTPRSENESSKDAASLVGENSLLFKSTKEKSEACTPKTNTICVKQDLLLLDTPRGEGEISKDAASLVGENSLLFMSTKENSDACTPKTNTIWVKKDLLLVDSCRAGDGSSKDATSLVAEDSSPFESPVEKSEACTPKTNLIWVKKDLLLLNTPRGEDESSNDDTSLLEEDSLPLGSPQEKSEASPPKTNTIWVKKDLLVLDTPIGIDESPKDAASLIEEDSFPLEFPKEKSEAYCPKIAASVVEQYSLILDSPREEESTNDYTNHVEENSLPFFKSRRGGDGNRKDNTSLVLEDSLLLESSQEKAKNKSPKHATCVDEDAHRDTYTLKKATEEDSLLLESSKNDNLKVGVVSPEIASRCVEKDTVLLESSNSPKHAIEEGQSNEVNLNLEKNKNTLVKDHTVSDINNGASTSAIKNDCDDISLDQTIDETLTNSEEIRNNIRMQLTNLRRGKNKFNFFKDVQQKRNIIDKAEEKITKKPFLKPTIAVVSTVKKLEPEIVKSKETQNVEYQEDDNVSNAICELRKIINKPKTSAQKESDTNIQLISKKEDELKNLTNELVKTKSVPKPNNVLYTVTEIRKIIGTLNTKINSDIDETNSNDKCDSETNENSNPFVSNTLDEFLSESKLNVSYDIPKSAAEEGIRNDYALDPIMLVDTQTIKDEEEKDNNNPKKNKKRPSYKPKTLAEKRRMLEQNKLKLEKQIKNAKVRHELDTRSYVMFKNKKVFIHSNYQNKCLAYVESKIPKKDLQSLKLNNKKPSLLKELYRKSSPVKYRPGPLSKKHTLQSDYSQWATELKPLPKVTVSIMPQFQKPIHANLIGIVNNQWDAEVSDDRVEFALTALKTEEPKKNIFKFDLKYENSQETLLVRKKLPDEKPEFKIPVANELVNHEHDDEIVAQVMDNLINYVEIKEIAPTLINDDVDDDEYLIEKKPRFKKVMKRKFNKTNRELLRLNCKVVSIEEGEYYSNFNCTSAYCNLGCVCSSLKSEHLIGIGKHCQKAKCIFECSCPEWRKETLTTDTVTKIEDISKKHLAKEEKEFTQTVICTNDKTFVVGMSAKPRRAAKTPKKYSDFFEEDVSEEKPATMKKEQVTPCYVQMEKWDLSGIVPYCLAHNLYNCYCNGTSNLIEEKKRKLSSQSEDSQNPEYTTISGRKVRKKSLQHKFVYEEEPHVPNPRTTPIPEQYLRNRKRKITDEIFTNDFINNIKESDRLRASTYQDYELDDLMGNEALKHYIIQERKLLITAHQRKQQHTVRQEEIVKPARKEPIKLTTKPVTTTKALKRKSTETVESAIKTSQSYPECGKKPKPSLIQRSFKSPPKVATVTNKAEEPAATNAEEPATTNAEEPATTNAEEASTTNAEEASTSNKRPLVEPVFKGEIICDDSAWLKKMCNNTQQPADSYARILPWPALLNGFISKTINVYCLWDAPLRLILTKDLKLKASKFLDVHERGEDILRAKLKGKSEGLIRQSEIVRDIVKWLITGNIHTKYTASALSFLLVEAQPKLFEVRGCCTQKPSSPPQPDKTIQPAEENASPENNETNESLTLEESAQSELTEIKHKNMYNQVMSLFITRNRFKSRELIEDGCDDDLSDNLYMWVELPEVCKVAKWRVVFLRNDFMYLHFKTVKYSIKYTDIVKLTEIAKDFKSTLMVRNLEIRRCHGHPSYGLHFSPKYRDRFFVGPYFIDFNEDDIETLVYRNQSLVSNSSLKSGDNSDKCGAWMYERGENKVADIVDLTEDDSPSPSVPSSSSTSLSVPCSSSTSSLSVPCSPSTSASVPSAIQIGQQEAVPNHIIFHNGMAVKVVNSKPRKPSEFNRFIITNIPHFGYLGAYQPDHSTLLEVSWPFEEKLLHFSNADLARDFLQERFNQVLQPIPETFKIQVIVLLNLDLTENKPIDSKYLSGNCICGIFGTLNIHEISEDYCQTKLKMSRKDIVRLINNKARNYMRSKLSELAKLNSINYKKGVGVDYVFTKTKQEIQKQQHLLFLKKAEIEALESKARTNLKLVYSLIKDLPIKERNLETRILNETIQIRPKGLDAVNANSVIEIIDDDEINMPSTSAVNFNRPGTSLLKSVSSTPAHSSLASLYPIRTVNNKSLLKINRLATVNTAEENSSANRLATVNTVEEDSSADIVWIE